MAIGTGATLIFTFAYAFDRNFANPNGAIATAIGHDAPYFGILGALIAGFVTASISQHHSKGHVLALVTIFVTTGLVQSFGRLQIEPWWVIVFSQAVPQIACSFAIWTGALIHERFYQGRRNSTTNVAH